MLMMTSMVMMRPRTTMVPKGMGTYGGESGHDEHDDLDDDDVDDDTDADVDDVDGWVCDDDNDDGHDGANGIGDPADVVKGNNVEGPHFCNPVVEHAHNMHSIWKTFKRCGWIPHNGSNL